jgi:hypothetical protein
MCQNKKVPSQLSFSFSLFTTTWHQQSAALWVQLAVGLGGWSATLSLFKAFGYADVTRVAGRKVDPSGVSWGKAVFAKGFAGR